MRQEFVSGVWHFATGRGNEWAGRNLVANAPPVELLQEVARGVGMCNWVRWEAGDCKGGAGGGDSQERGMEGRSVQKGGGGVWGICRGAGDKSSDQIFCLVQQFLFGNNSFCRPLAQASGTACNSLLRICSRVRCRLSFADYLARLS